MSDFNLDAAIRPGTKIGDWVVCEFLDAGTFSAVYLVQNRRNPKLEAALRIRRTDSPLHGGEFEAETDFLAEQLIPGRIPAYFARGVYKDEPYCVMERVRPIKRDRSVRQAYRIFRDAAESLAALHAKGRRHGDVKPANLGLAHGTTVLLDTGCGDRGIPGLDKGASVATPAFLPEGAQARLLTAQHRDVHALALAMRDCCGPQARAVFAPAIDEALSLIDRPSKVTAKEFQAKIRECYKKQLVRIAVRSVFLALAAIILGTVAIYARGYYSRLNAVEDKHLDENEIAATVGLVRHYYDNPTHRDTAKAFHYCEKALANEAALDDKDRGYIHGVMAESLVKANVDSENIAKALEHATIGKSLGDARADKVLGIITRMRPDLKAP